MSELENMAIEITQIISICKKKKRVKKKKAEHTWTVVKYQMIHIAYSICAIGIPEKRGASRAEEIFEEIMALKFPKLVVTDTKPQWTPKRINTKTTKKLGISYSNKTKKKKERENLDGNQGWAGIGEDTLHTMEKIRITADFSLETIHDSRK